MGGGIYPYTQQYAQCVSCKQDSHNNYIEESHGVCVVFIEILYWYLYSKPSA